MRWFRWKAGAISPQIRKELLILERRIDYRFRRPVLLLNALKHRSYVEASGEKRLQSNERLEFLGDAVLDLVISEHFFRSQSSGDEGALTIIKSTIVSGPVLAAQARKIGLGRYLLLSENEARSGGRERESILEDAFEALIGAIFLDGGLRAARQFVQSFVLADSREILNEETLKNYKSELLEYAQAHGMDQPTYFVLEESGPDHAKTYQVEVRIGDKVVGTGTGKSKKEAEQQAAAEGMRNVQ